MKKYILFGLATTFSFAGINAQNDKTTLKDIEVARQVIAEYVDTRQAIAKVKNEWKAYQQLTEDRISLYRNEIEKLQAQISTAEEETTQAEREISKIRDSIEELKAATRVVTQALPSLEDSLLEIYGYFPEPLKEKVNPLVKRLGKKNSSTADRMAILIGVMNEADKFNAEFNLAEDERIINGETKLVDVIYVGLAVAYYADKEGKFAGVGSPSEGEWTWRDDNTIASAVHESVQYFNGDIKPALMVELPISTISIDSAN